MLIELTKGAKLQGDVVLIPFGHPASGLSGDQVICPAFAVGGDVGDMLQHVSALRPDQKVALGLTSEMF